MSKIITGQDIFRVKPDSFLEFLYCLLVSQLSGKDVAQTVMCRHIVRIKPQGFFGGVLQIVAFT